MKIKIILIRLIVTPLVFIVLYIGFAYVFSKIKANQKVFEGEKNQIIYVHTNGLHLDIALSRESVNDNLKSQLNIKDNSNFVSFGWGDKGFYLETPEWSDLKTTVALKAMLLPSETAMHVTRYISVEEHWIKVEIDNDQLEILNEYITESFTKEDNNIIELENTGNYDVNDSFYEAENSYHLIRTCNMWVNNALKEIGVPTSVWCPFDWGVLNFLKR